MPLENKIEDIWTNGDTSDRGWLGQFVIEDDSLILESYNPINTNNFIPDTSIYLLRDSIVAIPTDNNFNTINVSDLKSTPTTRRMVIDEVEKHIYWLESNSVGTFDGVYQIIPTKVIKSDLNYDNRETIFEYLHFGVPTNPSESMQDDLYDLVFDHKRMYLYALIEFGLIVRIDLNLPIGSNSIIVSKSSFPSSTYNFTNNIESLVNILADNNDPSSPSYNPTEVRSSSICLDVEENILYIYSRFKDGRPGHGVLGKIDLNSSTETIQFENILYGSQKFVSLSLDKIRNELYSPGKITYKVNVDGSNFEIVDNTNSIASIGDGSSFSKYDRTNDNILFTSQDRAVNYDIDTRSLSEVIYIQNVSQTIESVRKFNFNSNYISKLIYGLYDVNNYTNVGFTDKKIYIIIDVKDITNGRGFFEIIDGNDVIQPRTEISRGITAIELTPNHNLNKLIINIGIIADIGKIGRISINSINIFFDEEPVLQSQPGCSVDSRFILYSNWSGGSTDKQGWTTTRTEFYQNALRMNGKNDGDIDYVGGNNIFTVGSGEISESVLLGTQQIKQIKQIGNGRDISVDRSNGYIYWSEISESGVFSTGLRDGIYRCNIDGTGFIEILELTPNSRPYGIQLHNNYIYYSSDTSNKIMRCNLDGSGLIELTSTTYSPKKFEIDNVTNLIIYVAHSDVGWGGLYSCPLGGGIESVIIDPSSNPILRNAQSVTFSSSSYLVASYVDDITVAVIEEGGSGINAIHTITPSPHTFSGNKRPQLRVTLFNPANKDSATFYFGYSDGWRETFFGTGDDIFFESFKSILIDSVYWITEDDVEITKSSTNLKIEFIGSLSDTKIQKTVVRSGNNSSLNSAFPQQHLYYINRNTLSISSIQNFASQYALSDSEDLMTNRSTNEILVAGNGVVSVTSPRRIRGGRIEGIDYGVTSLIPNIRILLLKNIIDGNDGDFTPGTILGITVNVKNISNCRLHAQSISNNPGQNFDSSKIEILEEFELIVGNNDFNFVVNGSESGFLNLRLIIESDFEGEFYAEILNISVCKQPLNNNRNGLSCENYDTVFQHNFDSVRNGWSGGFLETYSSSIVNITTNSGDLEFVDISRQIVINKSPFGLYMLKIQLGDIINFENDPGPNIIQDIFININDLDGNLYYSGGIIPIYTNLSFSSFSGTPDSLIKLLPGTYTISIRMPLYDKYYSKDGVSYPFSNPPVNSTLMYFRRKIEIDQIVLCYVDPNINFNLFLNHGTNFSAFLAEIPTFFHSTSSRFVLSGCRHSTDFLTFLPKYIIASGEYEIPSYNMIGETEVDRFRTKIEPECANKTRLNNHKWHTSKLPNNCKNE